MFKGRTKKGHKPSQSFESRPPAPSISGPIISINSVFNTSHTALPLDLPPPPPQKDSPDYNSPPVSTEPPRLPPIPRIASVRQGDDKRFSYLPPHHGPPHLRGYSVDSWNRPIVVGGVQKASQMLPMETVQEFKHTRMLSENDADPRRDTPPLVQERFVPTIVTTFDSRPSTRNGGDSSRPSTATKGHKLSTSITSSAKPHMSVPVREPVVSPSQFPVQSHRAPPMPPNAVPQPQSQPPPPPPQPQPVIHSYISVPKLNPAPKPAKTKLNLLNMSRLLRRKQTPEIIVPVEEPSFTHRKGGSMSSLPSNYDPSIRGVRVHDFSTPRGGRNTSSSWSSEASYRLRYNTGRDSPGEQTPHTPVFKEVFEDDIPSQTSEAAVRAEVLANQDFIARNSDANFNAMNAQPVLPPFAPVKEQPQPTTPPTTTPNATAITDNQPMPSPAGSLPLKSPYELDSMSVPMPDMAPVQVPSLSPVVEDAPVLSTIIKRQSAVNRKRGFSASRGGLDYTKSINPRRSRANSTNQDISSSNLPSHMSSRASRFSFQLVGKDSAAQEQMLEERHKRREAAKRAQQQDEEVEDNVGEYNEDDFDFDGMDDMEEEIPMVGDDWNYGGEQQVKPKLPITIPNMPNFSPTTDSAVTESSPGIPMPVQGLGIMPGVVNDLELQNEAMHPVAGHSSMKINSPQQAVMVDQNFDFMDDDADDLYFDDGLIDEVNADSNEVEKFDESVFDDPSHPLYERKPVMKPVMEIVEEEDSKKEEDLKKEGDGSIHSLVPKNSVLSPSSEPKTFADYPNPHTSPEQLSSYHEVLAAATAKAFEQGRFKRASVDTTQTSENRDSFLPDRDSYLPEEADESPSHPGLIPDDSRHSKATTISPLIGPASESPPPEFVTPKKQSQRGVFFAVPQDNPYASMMGYASDFSDYDSTLEEDPIIAAANADALADDYDGEYGREFGFYARPSAEIDDEETTFANGGYFGPKEWSEIKRQRSTREPNLTPITERSEYSTRNSFVSLQAAQADIMRAAAHSPNLAQLARMSPGWDPDANMEALMRLRRGAFGGSQTSLGVGSNGGRDTPSSPLASSPIVAKMTEQKSWPTTGQSPALKDSMSKETTSSPAMLPVRPNRYTGEDWGTFSEEEIYQYQYRDSYQTPVPMPIPMQTSSLVTTSGKLQEAMAQETQKTTAAPTPISQGRSSTTTTASTSSVITNPNELPTPLKGRPAPIQTSEGNKLLSPFPMNGHKTGSGTFLLPATPVSPTLKSAGSKGHSRNGSDSVTYVREAIGDGEMHAEDDTDMDGQRNSQGYRWIVERRRRVSVLEGGDDQEVLVGRDVVPGGNI
jgi:hypothetical protein